MGTFSYDQKDRYLEEIMKRFYPDYLVEILFFVFLTIETVFILSILFPPSLGREINPVSPYTPEPEWYFYWIYELLRYFPKKFITLGAFYIPFFMFLGFLLIPWIDRRMGRGITLITGFTIFIIFLSLTLISFMRRMNLF